MNIPQITVETQFQEKPIEKPGENLQKMNEKHHDFEDYLLMNKERVRVF